MWRLGEAWLDDHQIQHLSQRWLFVVTELASRVGFGCFWGGCMLMPKSCLWRHEVQNPPMCLEEDGSGKRTGGSVGAKVDRLVWWNQRDCGMRIKLMFVYLFLWG